MMTPDPDNEPIGKVLLAEGLLLLLVVPILIILAAIWG